MRIAGTIGDPANRDLSNLTDAGQEKFDSKFNFNVAPDNTQFKTLGDGVTVIRTGSIDVGQPVVGSGTFWVVYTITFSDGSKMQTAEAIGYSSGLYPNTYKRRYIEGNWEGWSLKTFRELDYSSPIEVTTGQGGTYKPTTYGQLMIITGGSGQGVVGINLNNASGQRIVYRYTSSSVGGTDGTTYLAVSPLDTYYFSERSGNTTITFFPYRGPYNEQDQIYVC